MKFFKKLEAFTLVELLIVCAIIAIITAIVVPNIYISRARGRDAEVRAQVQTIKLAIARAAAANTSGAYPSGSYGNAWYCLTTTSGTCFKNGANEDDTLNNNILPYFPGKTFPQAQGAVSGQWRYNAYVYNPYDAGVKISGYNGPVLLWWQEKVISQADCNGTLGATDGVSDGTSVYYCFENLAQ